MFNNFLIPPGFKDEVTFNAYVEHEYKNKIIEYFKVHGFDLVKTPLIEFKNKQNDNNFLIESKFIFKLTIKSAICLFLK